MPEGVHDQTKAAVFPKSPPRKIRQYRYLTLRPDTRERVHLVREGIRCGKPGTTTEAGRPRSLHDGDGELAHERDRHRMGADAVASDAESGLDALMRVTITQ